MFKKILILTLLFSSLLFLTGTALADSHINVNYTGYSLEYTYADGNASVYKIRDAGSALTVDIPEFITVDGTDYNVTAVGNGAFRGNTKVKSVSGPSVVTVGELAFYNCTNLTSVSFPKATSAGKWSFTNCRNLTSVNLPNTDTLEPYAFQNCSALTNVSLPKVSVMNDCSFRNCTNLKTLSCPNVTKIGQWSFARCSNLTNVEISGSNTKFYTDADGLFEKTGNGTVLRLYLSKSAGEYKTDCDNIGEFAFYGRAVTKVDLPNATFIDEAAFSDCTRLNTVIIGPDMTEFNNLTFTNCTNLTAVYFTGSSLPSYNETNSFGNVSNNIVYYRSDLQTNFNWKNLTGTKGIYHDYRSSVSPVTISIRFDANSGSGTPAAALTDNRTNVAVPFPDYQKNSISVTYWTTEADDGGELYWPGTHAVFSEDTVLYAQYYLIEEPTEEPTEEPSEPTLTPTFKPKPTPTVVPTPTVEPTEPPTVEPAMYYNLSEIPDCLVADTQYAIPVTISGSNVEGYYLKVSYDYESAYIDFNNTGASALVGGIPGSKKVVSSSGTPKEFTILITPRSNVSVTLSSEITVDGCVYSESQVLTFSVEESIETPTPTDESIVLPDSGNGKITWGTDKIKIVNGSASIPVVMTEAYRVYAMRVALKNVSGANVSFNTTGSVLFSENGSTIVFFAANSAGYSNSDTVLLYNIDITNASAGSNVSFDITYEVGSMGKVVTDEYASVNPMTVHFTVPTEPAPIYQGDLIFDKNYTFSNRSGSMPVYIGKADRIQGMSVRIENVSGGTVIFNTTDSVLNFNNSGNKIIYLNSGRGFNYSGDGIRLFNVDVTNARNATYVEFDLNFSIQSRGVNSTAQYIGTNPIHVKVYVDGPATHIIYDDGITNAQFIPADEVIDPALTNYHVSDDRAYHPDYVFTGWRQNGAYVAPGDTISISGNTTLVAQWAPLQSVFRPTIHDVLAIRSGIVFDEPMENKYDVNRDGLVNIFDLVLTAQYVADYVAYEELPAEPTEQPTCQFPVDFD